VVAALLIFWYLMLLLFVRFNAIPLLVSPSFPVWVLALTPLLPSPCGAGLCFRTLVRVYLNIMFL